MSKRKQFIEEHNQLSPPTLQVTSAMLARFRIDKANLFKDNNWSIEKLRRPLIMWLTSFSEKDRKGME